MPNNEQVDLLYKSVDDWNKWRDENPNVWPDLSGANLREADLSGANLTEAYLEAADLSNANLTGAGLGRANLTGAVLTGAVLTGAVLTGANLREAALFGAGLQGADLNEATLTGALLTEADLREAVLFGAHLNGASLREAVLFGAHLNGASLREATLTGALLTDADLSKADLSEADLNIANLSEATLTGANLNEASLIEANLTGANLSGHFPNWTVLTGADLSGAGLVRANLGGALLTDADLREADLSRATLHGADLRWANLREANLSGADLRSAVLVNADLTDADLTGCHIHGVSAWGLKLEGVKQQNLVITSDNEPAITVDKIEVAQFVYLMLNNQKIRDVIDTITSKAVLILGRFTANRKTILDALREELRKRDYLPILFDFDVPTTRDITETVSLLARMARFVVADITDAKSIPQELAVIVPHLPSVPVQPLLLEGSAEYGMFEHFKRFPWVLKTYRYPSPERLIADLRKHVIGPAEKYAQSVTKATPRRGARRTGSSSRTRPHRR
jgi:uncharacterized protein YjbI with pentapeptide repeats